MWSQFLRKKIQFDIERLKREFPDDLDVEQIDEEDLTKILLTR